MIKLVLTSIFLTTLIGISYTANILAAHVLFSKSHYILSLPLHKELARSGHNVTVITIFSGSNLPKENFNEILIDLPSHFWTTMDEFKAKLMENTESDIPSVPANWDEMQRVVIDSIMKDKRIQDLMHSNFKFDLFITENAGMDYMIGFAHYFNAPTVLISPLGASPWVTKWTGSPSPPAFVPFIVGHNPKTMNFGQRVQNTLLQALYEAMLLYWDYYVDKPLYDEYFPDPKPSFFQARKDAVSLVLMNSHISLDGPQPLMTNIIEVAGMQVNTKTNPLPNDLQKFLDDSKNGVVYFSFGTNVEASLMHETQRTAIVKVLSELKENVVLKWDHPESVAHVPKGKFYASDWLPQSDILAHPKIKLFVSHGGLMGTTETIYRGVPTVGVPFFADQQANVKYQESLGIGVRLSYTNLTETSLRWAINEVLSNPKYRDTVRDLSVKFKDRPEQPLETAKWWIEYVIRHKGARFLRSPALKLNWFEYNNLDVYALIFAVVYLVYFMLKKIMKFIYAKVGRLWRGKVKTQ